MPGPRICGRDPATAGISDSKQALTYDAPKREDVD
ncbi:phage holin [uncultured Gemmiger sp.]